MKRIQLQNGGIIGVKYMDSSENQLYEALNKLDTEQRNAQTSSIDLADSTEIVRLINDEDQKVAKQVEKKLKEISEAVDFVSESFALGGIYYILGQELVVG